MYTLFIVVITLGSSAAATSIPNLSDSVCSSTAKKLLEDPRIKFAYCIQQGDK